jgi:O-antigen/teichoic acid export membrane protein
MVTIGLAAAISTATFPALARLQSDRAGLRRTYLDIQHYSALLLLPIGLGLTLVAPAFVHALYPRVWWPMAPVMQSLAIFTAAYAIAWPAGDVYKAVGRPDLLWKLALAQAPLLAASVLCGTELDGILGAAVAHVMVVVPFTAASFWLVHQVLNLELRALTRTFRTAVVAGGVMVGMLAVVAWVITPVVSAAVALLAETAVGAITYVGVVLAIDDDLRTRTRTHSGRLRIAARRVLPVETRQPPMVDSTE